MKKSLNLNSAEWCDVIFEGKNKSYGAFELRQSSGKRHIIAFGIIGVLVLFIAFLPSILSTIKAAKNNYTGGVDDVYSVVQVDNKKEELIADIVKPDIPEPPVYRKMEKFVPPTIVDRNEVADDDPEMASVSDVLDNKEAVVGAFTVKEGSTDPTAELKKFASDVMNDGTGKGGGGDEAKPILVAEIPPQFPGGIEEMYKYIAQNLKYPVVDQEMGIEGRVTIQFVVSKTGDISDIQLKKGVSVNCDKEAVRVIKSMPKWIPGMQNGHKVAVYFTIPIVFKLKS